MFTTRPLWIRAIEGANGEGSAPAEPTGETPEETAGGQEQGNPPAEVEDPNGRGSKQSVLADLARERDKRQALEARLAEFEQAEEERKRSEMTEIERLQADLEASRKAEEDARAEIAKRDLDAERARIAAEFNSSPHTRRYFPVSQAVANVGYLLRTRGGISTSGDRKGGVSISSPHTRRYFRCHYRRRDSERLFSAHAEVFPIEVYAKWGTGALLRTRGGISTAPAARHHRGCSSPHTRRYFQIRI